MKHRAPALQGTVLAALLVGWLTPAALWALPPAPPNDDPASAEVIGPVLPALILGTSVLADDSIHTLPELPAIDAYVDGPDVFYSFTPEASSTYRIQLYPWHHAPLRSSDRRFTIYVLDGTGTGIAGVRAPGSARPVHLDVALDAGVTYTIGVDHDDVTHDNFRFTLVLDKLSLTNPDNCSLLITLPNALPVLVLNDIDGAANDFSFVQGTGRCAVSGSTPTTAPGIDHVYRFVAPADGDYAIELIGEGFDPVLYVNDICPPDFPAGCLGASNHSTASTSGAKHELIVVTLTAAEEYFIFVDNGSTTNNSGAYTLIIDDAFEYEINEIEPNDTPVDATVPTTPLNGGQLAGPLDEDWYAIDGLGGDRVYAWVNNGGSTNSTLDTDLGFYAPDGVTLIEFDDEDGDGADAPIEDLRYIYSTTSPVIAGGKLVSDGTHYLRVTDQSDTGTVHRYRLHIGVEPVTRVPLQECEPNDTIDTADYTGKHYYTGVIDTTDDQDFYAFEAQVGDRVFVAFDGDPERDATGFDSANTDPNAFHGKLVVYDPAGDVLISDISDSNSIQSPPDYPAQGGFFVARTAGAHYVEVRPQSTASQVGPTETYDLAIFLNDAAPALAEDTDPVVTLTPDYLNDVINGSATDNAPGDTGICDVALYANTNLQITNLSSLPAGTVTFDIELIDPLESGLAKLLVMDCAGNTACEVVRIDVDPPLCEGFNFSGRNPRSLYGPMFIPDNESSGPGIDAPLEITESGTVTDVNVTVTFETTSCSDLDMFLVAPDGTTVELQTDRGSSLAFNIIDATFDDDAEETMPILSGDEPYTGTWLPEGNLADMNGHEAQGTWLLNVRDDSSSQNGGSRLVRWSMDIEATFAGPQTFAGTASDTVGFDAGIGSIVLTNASNVQLNLPPDFEPGDQVVEYTVTLINSSLNGSGTVVVTDLQDNTCESIVTLSGLADATAPVSAGDVTTNLTFQQEVQANIPAPDPAGVIVTINVPDSVLVGEVEAEITVDTKDLGRLAATLSHGGAMASLVNRVGMDERQSVGLTKNTFWITLDDDAPQEDDAHLEPALGSTPFLGLHQPDGRGEFIGDGITTDDRDNMMFALAGQDSAGAWDLFVGDFRMLGSTRSEFRRWAMTIKSPCGPERYVGRATDLAPGSGITALALAGGATNLALDASFSPGDEVVDYVVTLVDPTQPGTGTLEITDVANNTASVPIALAPAGADQSLPTITGSVDPVTHEFQGTATDNQPGDTGIVAVELAPYSENLQLVSITPDPPGGAGSVDFVVGLVSPFANGRGYVRVTDGCGWRSYILVAIDGTTPLCAGSVGTTRRYVSDDLPQSIPDNSATGVTSSIMVADADVISDVNITLNITHGYDDDLDVTLAGPMFITLFTDIGSTGNDFIDTTLDDEAAAPIPDQSSKAPFTGSYQPEGGPALFALDGSAAAATYNLNVADDKTNDTGTFDSWSITIESPTFPERYDGRVEDSEPYASGVCSIELLAGAWNLTLKVDPFVPGATIVRYSVDAEDPDLAGSAQMRISDCAGNLCEFPVLLIGFGTGDMDCDGDVDFDDINPFVLSLSGEAAYLAQYPSCVWLHADCDGDGDVDFDDINPFVALLGS